MTKMNEMTNMSKQTEAMKLALDKVQEFKSRWCKVPPFADRVNKATREAITLAQVPIFELEHVLQKALAEQPAPVAEPHKQQEPYGWKVDGYIDLLFGANAENEAKASAKEINSVAFPLYTSPQPAQQEPVTDRENAIIRFALHQFMSNAYSHMDEAAQDKDGRRYALDAVERFAKDAKDAEALLSRLQFKAPQPAPVPEPHKQQEPVATLWQHGETGRTRITMPEDITDCDARWFKAADLYTSPPAQRTWVGLTDEERIMCRSYDPEEAVTKTEAKLKEKNT